MFIFCAVTFGSLFKPIQTIVINHLEGRGAVEPVVLLVVRQAEEKLLSAKQTDCSENFSSEYEHIMQVEVD